MRRKDREITDVQEILKIMEKCDECNLAFQDEIFPYIVPMNFGVIQNDGKVELYFHCAKEGKKLDLLRKNANVGFSMNTTHKLYLEDEACKSTMTYESVCGNGVMSILPDKEKISALTHIMKHFKKAETFQFNEKAVQAVTVLRLEVNELSGKISKKQPK